MPGVVAVLHRGNIGKIFRSIPGPGFSGICEERRPPFEDDVVRYYGQYERKARALVTESYEPGRKWSATRKNRLHVRSVHMWEKPTSSPHASQRVPSLFARHSELSGLLVCYVARLLLCEEMDH
jgi:xanthine dehydrogenase YagR molybdenum-binding subunit